MGKLGELDLFISFPSKEIEESEEKRKKKNKSRMKRGASRRYIIFASPSRFLSVPMSLDDVEISLVTDPGRARVRHYDHPIASLSTRNIPLGTGRLTI